MVFDISKISGIGEYNTCEACAGISSQDRTFSSPVVTGTSRPVFSAVASEDSFKETVGSASVSYKVNNRVFLVVNKNTIEVRTDAKLKKLLIEKYESVMESRYFGRGGIEIVNSGQLEESEIEDLIRLSYNLTKESEA